MSLRHFGHMVEPRQLISLYSQNWFGILSLHANLDVFFWSVDNFAHLLTRTSNTDWNKSTETMQLWNSDRWSNKFLHHVYVCKPLCWKEMFNMHRGLLQHSRSLALSFTSASPCRPIEPPPHTSPSFPTCALKSLKRMVRPLVLALRRASLISSTNSGYTVHLRLVGVYLFETLGAV